MKLEYMLTLTQVTFTWKYLTNWNRQVVCVAVLFFEYVEPELGYFWLKFNFMNKLGLGFGLMLESNISCVWISQDFSFRTCSY